MGEETEERQQGSTPNPIPNRITAAEFLNWKHQKDADASAKKAEVARKRAEDIAAGVVPMNGRELFQHEPWSMGGHYNSSYVSSCTKVKILKRLLLNLSSSDFSCFKMSQNSDLSENNHEEVSQISDYHDSQVYNFMQQPSQQHSIQQPYEHHQIHHTYVQVPSDQFVLNQHGMYSSSRPMFNHDSEHAFTIRPNLLPEGYTVNPNRAAIPSVRTRNPRANYGRGRMPILRGSSSRSGREVLRREYMETTNHQNPNVSRNTNRDHRQEPQNPRTIPIRNRLYDPSYAEIGQPVDPYLRLMELNPNFCNNKDNK